jgi:hypothetical protein
MSGSVLQVLETELETLLSQHGEISGKITAVRKSIELLKLSYGVQLRNDIEAPPAPAKKRGRKPIPAQAKPDYQTWITKKEAAAALGMHTKSVEQFVKRGKLRAAKWRPPAGGHQIVVCNPEDIRRIREERESVGGPVA